MSVQLSQLYIAAMVAGGVLSAGSLLLGDFRPREEAGFTPRAWLTSLGSGLTWAGLAGLCSVVGWPSVGQRASLWPAIAAGVGGALIGLWLQMRASRSLPVPQGSSLAEGEPPAGEG